MFLNNKRESGILLPIFSLPSKYGIGSFSKEAYEFVDFLVESGLTKWQILPLSPTSFGDSPYQSVSSYAGNPYFIDLDKLLEMQLLSKDDLDKVNFGEDDNQIDYGKIYKTRFALLKKAFKNSFVNSNEIEDLSWYYDKESFVETLEDYKKFIYEEGYWLENYALFMCLKDKHQGKAFTEWDDKYKKYNKNILEELYKNKEDFFNIRYYRFIQFLFEYQWKELKQYANNKGIEIIGDVPFYVSLDSVECWCDIKNFEINDNYDFTNVAGCPPDAFSEKGQLWGNPIYNWEYLKNTNYNFWIERLKRSFKLYDIVRIDHFRAFDSFFSIPAGSKDATVGEWKKGPGKDFFIQIEKALGKKKIIAENLGVITDSVNQLLNEVHLPGMNVLQFAFNANDLKGDNNYLPHNYIQNSVVYTGTHDNKTTLQYVNEIDIDTREYIIKYLGLNNDTKINNISDIELLWQIIRLAISSVSNISIIPMQDYLEIGKEGRINFPSTIGNNWKWRMKKDALSDMLSKKIKLINSKYGR